MGEDDLIAALRAMAHPLRWRILSTLAAGARNVGEIERESGIAQPALSQQLSVLRKAGMVTTRKQAKLVFYALEQDTLEALETSLSSLSPVTPRAHPPRMTTPGVANFARLS